MPTHTAPAGTGAPPPAPPKKTREIQSHHFDSTVWNDFQFRDDDVIIGSYAKSGTTWTQQVVGQLIFGGDPDVPVADISPWLDLRVPPRAVKLPAVEAQAHRRFVKTHLPVDALVFSPEARYIYVTRDGRDIVWSLHNHHTTANALFYELINDTPGRVGPPLDRPDPDPRSYFLTWLERDGHPFWSFWENLRTWWAIRHLPNIMLLHYNDLKTDLPGQIRRIASFLDIGIDEDAFPRIVRHCSFDHMKANASRAAPLGGVCWDGGGGSFIHKGTNGRWRDALTPADVAAYEQRALAELGPDLARWMMHGGPTD